MANRDHLQSINQARRGEIESLCGRKVAENARMRSPRFQDYPLSLLMERITVAISDRWRKESLELRFDMIDRARFGGDISLKIPQLLAEGGPKTFMQEHVPWILDVLSKPHFKDAIKKIETKGMYVNLTLTDQWLMSGVQCIVDMETDFGNSNALATRTFVVDYSSPNVAKVLHAGHIRSTIIGHVLSNILDACGALVYRVNHINDFGGFGFILEGYRRFKDYFPHGSIGNSVLLEIYAIRRTLERIVEQQKSFNELNNSERTLLNRYFPGVRTIEQLICAHQDFVRDSGKRFAALEAGNSEEVVLWEEMVAWSLSDFDLFYDSLNIRFDLVIGESFYQRAGLEIVDECLSRGSAIVFTNALAGRELEELNEELAMEQITETDYEANVMAIRKDIGAVVVRLGKNDRYVIRRADGRSIYSTRDLGAIKLRCELFDPTDIVYVVGQEQKVHFDRLFRTAYHIGLADPSALRFQHLYFGFYVDAHTGEKLSSRDTVANVNHLLAKSFEYFRNRLSSRVDQSVHEIEKSARELSVGSLVFNDLVQDLRGRVPIETGNVGATIERFEKSGGAYVVYTTCRATAILRKHGKPVANHQDIRLDELDDQEAALILSLLQLPRKVVDAATTSNPSILVRYLLDIAAIYNSYYHRAEVIRDGDVNEQRLLITRAVEQTLTNGLKICHVQCPNAI